MASGLIIYIYAQAQLLTVMEMKNEIFKNITTEPIGTLPLLIPHITIPSQVNEFIFSAYGVNNPLFLNPPFFGGQKSLGIH